MGLSQRHRGDAGGVEWRMWTGRIDYQHHNSGDCKGRPRPPRAGRGHHMYWEGQSDKRRARRYPATPRAYGLVPTARCASPVYVIDSPNLLRNSSATLARNRFHCAGLSVSRMNLPCSEISLVTR